MARVATTGGGKLPEFMTSPSVGDFFVEWLGEQVAAADRREREEGSSRASGWELRTLRRAHGQLTSLVSGIDEED